MLESEAKLPVELAIEREKRAARIRPAAMPIENLPQVRLPYRMWRAPALDFIVNAGVTYQASTGMRVDRSASVAAAGEIARLSYDAMLITDDRGRPQSLRVRAYRSDPEGGMLGPLNATHFAVGDVGGLTNRLLSSSSGRGAEVTNRPLFNPVAFDRTRFEGDLPTGWDAELYRNGELLAFSRSDGSQRYVFDDVPLLYGDNRFEIIVYGPQGQQRSRLEYINVGQEQVPPGKTWYWAGVSQPGKDMLGDFVGRDDGGGAERRTGDSTFAAGSTGARPGRTWPGQADLGRLARDHAAAGNEKTDLRRRLGPPVDRPGADRGRGRARRQGRHGRPGPGGRADRLDQHQCRSADRRRFHRSTASANDRYRDARLSLDAPLKIRPAAHFRPCATFASSIAARTIDRSTPPARLSANFNGFNLSHPGRLAAAAR